jgi:hypothetical protein
MTIPGKVIVRFLAPIQRHEAKTRDEMSKLLRIRMLQALGDGPSGYQKHIYIVFLFY